MRLRSGIPRLDEVRRHVRTDLYGRMLACDEVFVRDHRRLLRRYRLRWLAQPMRHWSRRWEYPYVAQRVTEFAAGRPAPVRLLDAGSGVTFLPHFLRRQAPGLEITCCDSNRGYGRIFDRLADAAADGRVRFAHGTLQELPVEERSQDAVCCVSVLEHTADYERILDEFDRVLRPGGLLVLTFDVSLDGRSDIPPEDARRLLASVAERFRPEPGSDPAAELHRLDDPDTILSTDAVRESEPELLPWRWPLLKAAYDLLRGRGWTGGFYSLTVCCLAAYRRGPAAGAESTDHE
ncbi:MAG: class I SAM-dependent methyltransferase [Planctomycetota bacterium]